MSQGPITTPQPLPYQRALVRYLQDEESELWHWFASTRRRAEQADAVRLDLLKSTYRLEPGTHPALYAAADEVLAKYGLRVPVTVYQAQTDGRMNAALAYLPGEAHIVLAGNVRGVLSDPEFRAVLAHELAHFLLYDGWDAEFFVAMDVLRALSNDPAAAPPHLESARLFSLYGEVFADRGAYLVTQDATAAISTLIKLETGLTEVSAESYLRQADEIFSKSRVQADQLTHPEPYIRARALALWAESGDEALPLIERMIEGPLSLDRLDLLGQHTVAASTRRLLHALLAPAWFRTEAVVAHARLFFEDFACDAEAVDVDSLAEALRECDPSLRDYYAYVLLDFVVVDRDLGDPAMAAALVLSRRLGFSERFGEIVIKELGVSKRQFSKLERDAEELLARANGVTTQA